MITKKECAPEVTSEHIYARVGGHKEQYSLSAHDQVSLNPPLLCTVFLYITR
jgi:hypothetical protein